MADYSGYPSTQMKVSLAKKKAQNKLMEQENERLKLENEILKRENYAIRMERFKQTCGVCRIRTKNACLGTEIERQYAGAARQDTEAVRPEVVELPFFPAAGSQEEAPLNQDEPEPSNQDEAAPSK